MGVGAPEGNKNAETWTEEEANTFLNKALELSQNNKYDFVGEVAKDLGQYHQLFNYLTKKFPKFKHIEKKIYANCESNCFSNGKKQNIAPSMAIMNLKSNHGWTDRIDNTTKGNEIKNERTTIKFIKKT